MTAFFAIVCSTLFSFVIASWLLVINVSKVPGMKFKYAGTGMMLKIMRNVLR